MRTSATHPLRVDFIPSEACRLRGRIGLTLAPGRREPDGRWHRDLVADLERLHGVFDTTLLVSLSEDGEFEELGIQDLQVRARDAGIRVCQLSIRDGGTPAHGRFAEVEGLVQSVLGVVSAGETVVLHCRGGLGRSGLIWTQHRDLGTVGASARDLRT